MPSGAPPTSSEETYTRPWRSSVVTPVHPNHRTARVIDVEERLVGGEAHPIRLVELVAFDQQPWFPTRGGKAIDPLPSERPFPLEAEYRHPAVPRVAEVDGTVGVDADIVGAVELAPLEVGGQYDSSAVGILSHERRCDVFADEQVEVGVVGHAVAFVGRALDFGDTTRVPASPDVAGHVGEQEMVVFRVPDRPLGEQEPRSDDRESGVGCHEVPEAV
jgi:hypothetical protein